MEKVVLIHTHYCPKCKEAMKKLDAAGVDYTLAAAEENEKMVEDLGITEAPTIVVYPDDDYKSYTKIYNGLGGVYTFLKSFEKDKA